MIRTAGKPFTAERQIARRDGRVLEENEIRIEAPAADEKPLHASAQLEAVVAST